MFNTSKKNIILFVLFIFFISLILFFWQHTFKVQDKNLNTLKYEKIIKKINIKNPENLKKIEKFIIQNNNIFGTLTALSLAKKYVLYNDLDKAFIQLNNSLKYTQDENLKNILKLNMAKIQIQKHKNKEAMNILKTIHNHNWDNIIENMKGDIFMNINNPKEAIKFWNKSLLNESSNASREIINMKINELKEKK
ncbi:tetratricopeptide repeat protein [Buchnera aphidicola (Sitobion miscanthi)]|uniref:YfgM family protein n=1 Tax=Buchnera aphidicola TaxID=9 RepID=UPI0020B6AA3D|nr:tetratricopeptide repeat protein [Buchnera aphidicola]MCU4137202.1 tetratricopeptide repeat protein [Buchnera aphidicola (Sitobion miscanthi)]